ncbi:XRE family transcriptional regulator [Metapseudomonas otitidis]|uniref:XRE family transcriptional regulator n=1 Tax=Metapseudomonas otitidis TaxID=319939 RepID=UPI0031F66AAA
MFMNESGSRLRSLLKKRDLTPKAFADLMQVEPQYVNNWFHRGVPAARAFAMADILKVSPRWLLDGEGEETPPSSAGVTLEPLEPWDDSTPLEEDEVEVPLYKEVEISGGAGRTAVMPVLGRKLRFSYATLRAAGVDPSNAFCAPLNGNSMEPLIMDGATIGVDRGTTNIVDGEIYALEHDGMLRAKYVYRLPGGGLRLKSFNSAEHPDECYSLAEVQDQSIVILGWVFWWSTLRRRAKPGLINNK